MSDVEKGSVITGSATVGEAIETMRREGVPAVAIVDDDNHLLGLFTNGDMRNYFLGEGDLSAPITVAMNPDPVCFRSRQEVIASQERASYIVYPLVNSEGRLMALDFGDRINMVPSSDLKDITLVMMAGGIGSRLRPYTDVLPKALIPIGGQSIAERIISQFYLRGCRDVRFIVNHKAEMIKAYFNSIETNYKTSFIREPAFMGTGGGLSLLKGTIDSTFILSNCDILIDDDLSCAYRTHIKQGNAITYVCAMMDMAVPYGVIETNDAGEITRMSEKPEFSFLVSTGVYVVEPWVIDLIEAGEYIDFPDLALRCKENGGRVGVFPIPGDAWIDIGEIDKMNSARERYENEI